MRVGVVSDSHGRLHNFPLAAEKLGPVDAWVHLGDYYRDAERIGEEAGLPVHAVMGNCDLLFPDEGKTEEVWEPQPGVRLLLTHGHVYGVKSGLMRLICRAEELQCTAALFGHTHIPLLERQGNLTLLNPGTLSAPYGGQNATCALLEIREDGEINVRMVGL